MNLDWILSPLAIYGVLVAGGAAALHLAVSTRIDLRRQEKLFLAGTESMRDTIAALEGKVQEMSVEARQDTIPPAVYTPFKGLNVHKRAEALRMYRRGSDRDTVSTVLGLPPAEVALLEKVYHLLSCGAAA